MSRRVHLSFSINPVQAFVSQARRTRDLWCGSWLLSFLAESALVGIEKHFDQADAIIPDRSKNRGRVSSIENATGGIPNRFEVALSSKEEAVEAGKVALQGFQQAWKKIADSVHSVVEPAFQRGIESQKIWDRQIKHFWELTWIVAEPQPEKQTIGEAAAARKFFRNVKVSDAYESGVKCSLMPELQELSGQPRSAAQDAFWKAVAGCENVGQLDIRPGERLSAIALIKRLFPKIDERVLGKSLNLRFWPSTAFFAATPWLREIDRNSNAKQIAEDYVRVATQTKKIGSSERDAAKAAGVPWATIDAPAWTVSGIQNNDWQISESEKPLLLNRLKQLYEAMGGRKPVPFYALLLMDGDRMGKLLDALEGPEQLSQCLGNFTRQVESLVAAPENCGRTIYAGGDDVLAMLPADRALTVADCLAKTYHGCFSEALENKCNAQAQATVSAAIVYAHWKEPLRQVLELAHHLLDEVAKQRTGRDALAIGIANGSGLNAVWSAPWQFVRERKLVAESDTESIIHRFSERESALSADGEKVPSFNASFLYHLRSQYTRLIGNALDQPGSFVQFGSARNDADNMFLALANAEFRRRLSRDQQRQTDATATRQQIKPLIELARHARRDEARQLDIDENSFGFDAWRVARFLKQVHDGELQDHE